MGKGHEVTIACQPYSEIARCCARIGLPMIHLAIRRTHPTLKHFKPNFQTEPAPFPMTPAGQKRFLDAVYRTVLNTPDNLGKGLFWWEPAVPAKSPLRVRGFFDDSGNALPVITMFDEYTRR